MKQIILLGDSIFDNQAYTIGAPDVITHLKNILPANSHATLKAVDGSTIKSISNQLNKLPSDASHLIISIGGNDALNCMSLLVEPAKSTGEVLRKFAEISSNFEYHYRDMIKKVIRLSLPTAISTIYYPRFPDAEIQQSAVMALTFFNDAIIRIAFQFGLPLLDLRLVCNEPDDYANPIEPSAKGGAKIAGAIFNLVKDYDFTCQRTAVFIK